MVSTFNFPNVLQTSLQHAAPTGDKYYVQMVQDQHVSMKPVIAVPSVTNYNCNNRSPAYPIGLFPLSPVHDTNFRKKFTSPLIDIRNYKQTLWSANKMNCRSNYFPNLNQTDSMKKRDASKIEDSNATAESASSMTQRTPMSRILKLARFNKVNHQYVLINESGPAHCKTFTVKLVLGENEQYLGEGLSIKRAQQNAASIALEQTKLIRPTVKFSRPKPINPYTHSSWSYSSPGSLLNGLLIKKNLTAKYHSCPDIDSDYFYSDIDGSYVIYPPNVGGNTINLARRKNSMHTVCLKIGSALFYGRGRTTHMAKHYAAMQAISALNSDLSGPFPSAMDHQLDSKCPTNESGVFKPDNHPLYQELTLPDITKLIESSVKGPVCIVYEIAVRSKMEVNFSVVSESGPAHEKIFVVEVRLTPKVTNQGKCAVTKLESPLPASEYSSYISCQGRGPSKRLAKNDACLNIITCRITKDPKMCTECLAILNSNHEPKPKPAKVKRETIVKALKMDPNYGQQINPISRLIQVQQAKREPEPKFELVEELGQGRYKEYVIQVEVNGAKCRANGPNKKLAKRTAAEIMLEKLGYNKPLPLPGKPVLKQSREVETVERSECHGGTSTDCTSSSLEKRRVKFDLEAENSENFTDSSIEAPDQIPQLEISNALASVDNPTSGWHQVDAPSKFSKRRLKCSKISSKDKLAFSQFEMTAAESTVIMPVRNCSENSNENFNRVLNPHPNFQVQNYSPKEETMSTVTERIQDLKLNV